MNRFVPALPITDPRDLVRIQCRCGSGYPVRWDQECSHCPRCERFNVHALTKGWKKRPK